MSLKMSKWSKKKLLTLIMYTKKNNKLMILKAVKLAGNAASMTMVNRVRSEIKELESLMNPNGQIDQNRLPCEIRLSNESRYRVLKQVGKGGMGTVFQAKLIAPDSDERNVALKICDASHDRAEREAAILKRLSHPKMHHVR